MDKGQGKLEIFYDSVCVTYLRAKGQILTRKGQVLTGNWNIAVLLVRMLSDSDENWGYEDETIAF